ncbi:hypothetical protein PsorP6_016657 [Peronosclerospora sorghi]|uniref:Uncharacterized protein n=1 Tax=Peronosclerospora sorghi TaxID=230839 RepID=A0ACC0VNS2_9STRA|nr:hypothetical protein PsorP6_019044 [Peronosclerospora sorghi]KAI9907980.1 hypothetical protein PsorP6_016657 [Peronosclerospora sorghi]
MLWLFESGNWNEYNLNPLTRINWRASLVPAAALNFCFGRPVRFLWKCVLMDVRGIFCETAFLPLSWWIGGLASFTVKKLECLKQAFAHLNTLAWNNKI